MASEPTEPAFGQLLREARIARGLTLEKLGEVIQKSKTYLSLIESGQRAPSVRLVEHLAEFFDADVDEWVFRARIQSPLAETVRRYPDQVKKFLRTARLNRKRS